MPGASFRPMTQTAAPVPQPRQAGQAHAVVASLKQAIYDGEFMPGERLNEAALALRMGTSRGPIREAMKVLEA